MPRPATILIVDENSDAREVYSLAFRHFGYNVLQARSGREGLDRAIHDQPDLIIMDLGLPGMNGWDATRLLKSGAATAGIPVLALTVHVHDVHRQRAVDSGCDGFVAKPCSPRLLQAEVEHLLARP